MRFVISAKGQAELRKRTHRVAESLTKPRLQIDAAASESKIKLRPGNGGFGTPHWGRESLRRTVQAAQNKNKDC
jgi:hypothetical protein